MSEQDLWQGVLYLHVLAMAFFVGGQLVFAIAVVPVERTAPDRERMRAIARRFGYGSLCALAVLVATGWAMAAHHDLFGDSTLQLKLRLVGLVVAPHPPSPAPAAAACAAGGDPARLPRHRLARGRPRGLRARPKIAG